MKKGNPKVGVKKKYGKKAGEKNWKRKKWG